MRLLLFAPCERVIIAEGDNNPTLIALLSNISGSYDAAEGEDIADDAMGPFTWNVFCLWRREPGDEGREFKQCIRLVGPDGAIRSDSYIGVSTDKPLHRVTARLNSIPVRPAGTWWLRLYLMDANATEVGDPAGEYPLEIQVTVNRVQPGE